MQSFVWVRLLAASLLCVFATAAFCQLPANRAAPAFQQGQGMRSLNQQANALPAAALKTAQTMVANGKPMPMRKGNFTISQQPQSNSLKKKNSTILAPIGCMDTSGHILSTESSDNIGLDYITKTHDDNILVPGFRQSKTLPNYTFPYLVKYNSSGDIAWSKSFDGLGIYPLNYAYAYKCFELADNSLLLVGGVGIPEAFNGRDEFAIWHLDANGNLIWVRTDSSSIWGQYNGGLFVTDMVQDAVGNIYLAGNHHANDALVSHTFVLKLDLSGNFLWDKAFSQRGDGCFGIAMSGNELSLIGTNNDIYISNLGEYGSTLWCLRMNPATGDTLWSKAWYPDYPGNLCGWNAITSTTGRIQQQPNGNFLVFGTALDDLGNIAPQVVHGIVAEFDPSFNFLQGSMIVSNVRSNYYNTVITGGSNGRVQYTYMTYLSSYDADILYGSILRGQIVKERIIHQRNRASAWASNFLFMDPASNYYVIFQLFADPVNNTSGDEMVRLHDSDTSTVCTGTDTMATWLEPYRMKFLPRFRCDYIASNTFLNTNRTMPAPVDGNLSQTNACKATSSCESFQVFADHDKVCAGAPITVTARKNEGCGAIPSWTIDTVNLQSYKILNDSMLQLTYRDATVTSIWGDVFGTCSGYDDYKILTVLPGSKPVTLNDDSYLCPDSALVLRPNKGFSSYTWQDGSAADTFLVQTPGKYYVTVTNTCSVPSSDTTVVQQAPFLSFSVGADLSICFRDPVNLIAPAGYNGYSWKDLNDGSVYNTPSIQLYPGSNTTYAATAHTDLGCFVKDTLMVTVSVPPPIDLGPDASFCLGDSLLLNAGSGFTNYSWSNGAQGATVYVHQTGSYSVKAQATGGCYSTDTMKVVNVYSLPLVNLGNNDFLCEGTVRTLNAGNGFRQYQWEDGSNAATLQVSATGMYWVQVTDNNGCMGGDTTNITQIISSPSGFLETDTLICDGYPSKIHAIGQFNNYSWSDGETGNYMTTRKGGTYSLTVTDSYGCSASANIVVNTKQCLLGVYFPNAFTPNRDGRNDYYKSDVFGNLAHYRLQIFNRWGQSIFETKDFSKGWDGTFHGQEQPVGGYAWFCNYQFEGEEEVQEKGTLMLLR